MGQLSGARCGPGVRACSRFPFCAILTESGFAGVRHLDPFRMRRGLGLVVVVPVPPFVGRGLRVAGWRVLPDLLAAERRDIEITPDGAHRLVAAIVDEVGAEHPL